MGWIRSRQALLETRLLGRKFSAAIIGTGRLLWHFSLPLARPHAYSLLLAVIDLPTLSARDQAREYCV